MEYKQKLTKIGNSVGITLPKSLRDGMNLSLGTEVFLKENPKNKTVTISLTPENETEEIDPKFIKMLKNISDEYSEALKELSNK